MDKTVIRDKNKARLYVGYGQCDITPEESVPLAGAGNTSQRMSQGILTRLYTTFLAFTDENDHTILLGSSDLLVMPDSYVHWVRTSISKETGVAYDDIMISATHSHNAPDQDNLAEPSIVCYLQKLQSWYVEAAVMALEDRKPAELLAGRTNTKNLNFVRHYLTEAGVAKGDNFGDDIKSPYTGHTHDADSQMQLVRFVRDGGDDILLVNWQVHPHRSSAKKSGFHYMVSADIVGVMRDKITDKTGLKVVYYTGAAGNLNPTSRIDEENVTKDYLEQGSALADYALSALDHLSPLKAGPIRSVVKLSEQKIDHLEDHKLELAKVVLDYWLSTNDLIAATKLARQYGINSPYHAQGIQAKYRLPLTGDVEMHAVSMGDFAFVTGSYEMFDTNGLYIKKNSPFAMTLIISLTNRSLSYIPSEEGFRINSYETNAGRFVIGTGEKLAEEYVALLHEVSQ